MARGVDDQKSWHIDWYFIEGFAFLYFLNELLRWEESSTDLLGDTTSFSLLNVSVADLVEQCGFTGIDVAEDATDRASEFSLLAGEIGTIVAPLMLFFLFLFLLGLLHHVCDFLFSWFITFFLFVLFCVLVRLL